MPDVSGLHGLGSSVNLFYQARYRLHIPLQFVEIL